MAQLSGSMSSAVGSRPASEAKAICVQIAGPKEAVNSSSSPGAAHGGLLDDLVPEPAQQLGGVVRRRAQTGSTSASCSGEAVVMAIRRPEGSRRGVVANGSAGSGAHQASPELGAGEDVEQLGGLADGPGHDAVGDEERAPTSGRPARHRPRWGLSPTRPQQAAGIRMEPPPSLAWAIGTMPAARPPRPTRPTSRRACARGPRGCASAPKRLVSVTGRIPYSGSVVVPTTMNPASRRPRDVVVVRREEVAEEVGRERQALALHRRVVLDGDRHAGERPRVAGADRVGGGQRLVGEDVDERVELRVELLDAVERRLHELARRPRPSRMSPASSSTGRNSRDCGGTCVSGLRVTSGNGYHGVVLDGAATSPTTSTSRSSRASRGGGTGSARGRARLRQHAPRALARDVETLVTPADLEPVAAAGRADRPADARPQAVLAEARELREAIDACVTAVAEGAPPEAAR